MKRTLFALSLILTLLLVLPMGTASAADVVHSGTCGVDGDNLQWSLDSDGTLTFSGTGAMEEYRYSSSAYDAPWYEFASDIRSIVFEEGVTSVANYAFYGSNYSGVESVKLPSTISEIGSYSFDSCSQLKTAGPAGIGIRFDLEFGWQDSIPSNAFCCCDSLERVVIPETTTSIAEDAFYYCPSLYDIVVVMGNPAFVSYGGALFDSDMTRLIRCPQAETGDYTVPSGVTTIENYAFRCCDNLTSITIPASVTEFKGGSSAVWSLESANYILFLGDAPSFEEYNTLYGLGWLTCYYYDGSSGWNISDKGYFKGHDRWKKIVAAGEAGWREDATGRTYLSVDENGFLSTPLAGERTIDGKIYLVQGNGYVLRDDYGVELESSGNGHSSYYYLGRYYTSDGSALVGWGYDTAGDRIYADASARIMSSEFFEDDGKTYYAKYQCAVAQDEVFSAAYHYDSSQDKYVHDWYCADTNGEIVKNAWYKAAYKEYDETEKQVYYAGEDGKLLCGTYTIDGNSYTFTEGYVSSISGKGYDTPPALVGDPPAWLDEQPASYSVSFNANGGKNAPAEQTKLRGETLQLPYAMPTRSGFDFIGWAFEADAEKAEYVPGGYFDDDESTTLYAVWLQPDLVLPADLTVIEQEAFEGGAFRYVKLPEGALTIGPYAFADCDRLAAVYVPESVSSIDWWAFDDVTELTILGVSGSAAEEFANDMWLNFIAVD